MYWGTISLMRKILISFVSIVRFLRRKIATFVVIPLTWKIMLAPQMVYFHSMLSCIRYFVKLSLLRLDTLI